MTDNNNLSKFKAEPAQKKNGHELYRKKWFFALRTIPEYAYGDMFIGSLHRRIGLAVVSEKEVSGYGSEFNQRLRKKNTPNNAQLEPHIFRRILEGALDYPRTSNQSVKRKLTILPLVPELANYTAPIRFGGNPWNLGELLAQTLVAGSVNEESALQLWEKLFNALDVNQSDDVWALFLKKEVEGWRLNRLKEKLESSAPSLKPLPSDDLHNIYLAIDEELPLPARQFVKDLEILLELQKSLTRREWIAYLESLLRLGSVMHSQWLCRVHIAIWEQIFQVLKTGFYSELDTVKMKLVQKLSEPWLDINNGYAAASRTLIQGYQRARYGLNLLLFTLESKSKIELGDLTIPGTLMDTSQMICDLSLKISLLSADKRNQTLADLTDLMETDPSISACKKGFTKGLKEFWLYGLAKRNTQLARDKEFDQGYWLQKRGTYAAAPWIIVPGPISLSFAAHSGLSTTGGVGTVRNLSQYFENYGIRVLQRDFEQGQLANRLRGLGLVVDSPDAESGMGVIDPLGGSKI